MLQAEHLILIHLSLSTPSGVYQGRSCNIWLNFRPVLSRIARRPVQRLAEAFVLAGVASQSPLDAEQMLQALRGLGVLLKYY